MKRFLVAALLAWAGAAFAADSFLLVSRKDMPDPNFRDTVVLVTRVDGATIGLILNRPTRVPVASIFDELRKNALPGEKLHFGGPVTPEFVTFLYKPLVAPQDAARVAEGTYLASDPELLEGILTGEVKVEALRVFAGYAGWAPGQLENEVSRGDWHVLPADVKAIFEKNPSKLWPEMDRRSSHTPVRFQPR